MSARSIAAGGAAAVAVPLILGLFIVPKEEKSSPAEESLAVELTSEPGELDSNYLVSLAVPKVDGAPAQPALPTRLTDARGRNLAEINEAKDANCAGGAERASRLPETDGTQHICLEVTGLRAGSVTAGALSFPTVGSSGTTLKVSLSARHNWWYGPLAVTAVAVILGALWAILSGKLIAINTEVAIRRRAKTANASFTESIRQWSSAAKAAGISTKDRYRIVDYLSSEGMKRLDASRQRLSTDLAGRNYLPEPFKQAAGAEASKSEYDANDIVDAEGKLKVLPAESLKALSEALESIGTAITIRENNPKFTGLKTKRRIELARTAFNASAQPDIASLQARVAAIDDAYVEEGGSNAELEQLFFGSQAAPALVANAMATAPSATWPFVNGLALLVVLVVGVATVLMTVWAPSTTFGTSSDYFKLASTAATTGAVASLAALILSWGRPNEADS